MVRLSEAVDRYAGAERARAELEREVRSEAQEALEQGTEVAMQIRREADQERAALQRGLREVQELHDGLLVDLRRVHGDLSGLLAGTDTPPAQALTAADPEREIVAARNGQLDRSTDPATTAKQE
jgi:hypothetical protein